MFDQVQTALTVAIDVIAFIGLFGLPAHAIAMHHIKTVRSWGIPQSMPIVEPVFEVEPEILLVIEPISVKRALQSVGGAAIDIQKFKDALTRGRSDAGKEFRLLTETLPEFKPLNLLLSERRLSASPHLRVSASSSMSARELREYCRTNKIKGYSKVLKEQGVKGLKLFVEKVLEE